MMNFKWGFSTLGCPQSTLPEALRLAEEFGFPYLELRTLGGSLDLPKELAKPENGEVLRQLTAQKRVLVLGSSFGISSKENDRDGFEALGRLADRFDIPYLRIFGGFDFSREPGENEFAAARENLDWIRSLRLKARPALETHDGYSSARRCRKLMEALNEELPIVWDAHHTWRFAGETLQESWNLLGPLVVDVHLKDSIRDSGGKTIATLPGEGDVPVEECLALLAAATYAGPVTFEYEKQWEPHLPELRIALEAFNRNWRANCNWLWKKS